MAARSSSKSFKIGFRTGPRLMVRTKPYREPSRIKLYKAG
jgi:hypothetical protein